MSVALLRCSDAEQFANAGDSVLTDWERTTVEGFAHPRRRGEWVAGRIAAKWLLLRESGENAPPEWPPRAHLVEPSDLEMVPRAWYRGVDVRRDASGAPYVAGDALRRAGGRISIAHRGGWAIAAVNAAGAIGVDLEAIAPRRSAFYEWNMSEGERRWMRGAPPSDTDSIGTLLWTIKEACLKTGASAARTIWELAAIDVDVAVPAAHVRATWPSIDVGRGRGLAALPANVPLAGSPRSTSRAAYGVVEQLVIGVVSQQPVESMPGELS